MPHRRRADAVGLRTRGFSVLEVLAAIVIFSLGATVLFDWIGQTARRMRAVSDEQRALFAQLDALEFARSLNPMARPSGDVVIAGWMLDWSSKPIGPETPARNAGGSEGLYVVRLYEVEMRLGADQTSPSATSATDAARPSWSRTLLLAGWRQVRRPSSSNPFGA